MRRLTNGEWNTFLHEVNVANLDLPPWGGIVEWSGMDVLVFVGPTGEVFLTDVTGEQELIERTGRTYDPLAQYWWYQLPEATTDILWQRAEDVDAVVKTAVSVATTPSTWTIALVALALIFILPQLKGART